MHQGLYMQSRQRPHLKRGQTTHTLEMLVYVNIHSKGEETMAC